MSLDLQKNSKIKVGIEEIKMKNLPKIADKYTNIQLKTDAKKTPRNLIISVSKNKTQKQAWYLISNLNFEQLQNIYENRFQIEKTFRTKNPAVLIWKKLKLKAILNLKNYFFVCI